MSSDSLPRLLLVSNDLSYVVLFRIPVIEAFRADGYDVYVAAPRGTADEERRLDQAGATLLPWEIRKNGRDPLVEFAALLRLWSIVRTVQPQIIFGYTIKPVIYGLIVGRLAGVMRRAAMITGLGYALTPGREWTRRITGVFAKVGYRMALTLANIVIFQNPDDVQLFRARRLLGPRTPVGIVNGSGVDLDHFDDRPLPPGPPTFLMVARLLRDKGVVEYVEAARLVRKQIPDARFLLVGAADSNPAAIPQDLLQEWIDEGIVEYQGHLRDPRGAFAACHIFVLPSYREGTPRTNLEAMAIGRAVISTDVPGCRETVVVDKTGLLVPLRDAGALAAAMTQLGLDLDKAAEVGRAGRAYCAERFELGSVTRATVSLIKGVV